ncbi:MAG: phosphotransferase family protein [Pseudomonadota bacterium]|nr:phosphotransferase family protein [Pseudomonadota bacterium]
MCPTGYHHGHGGSRGAANMIDGINLSKVTDWVQGRIPEIALPLDFELIAGGHSNLTFKFTDTQGSAYVLRRPPLGHVLESAHDMGREHRIVSALSNSSVPVAPTYGLCEDTDVNGAPFYLMGFVSGVVLHNQQPAQKLTEAERHSFGLHAIEVLSDLHLINPDDVGLGQLGRKEAYIERQLKRWTKQWEATKTHEIPEMDESLRLLHEDLPVQVGAAIVHGDYRPGNMIVAEGRMAALLDWELCTLGDPLADVGYMLNNWPSAGERGAENAPTALEGFPDRGEIQERYEVATGRSLERINYYRAFSHWRLGAITQGVYKRYLVGAMGKQEFDLEAYKEGISTRARSALKLLTD